MGFLHGDIGGQILMIGKGLIKALADGRQIMMLWIIAKSDIERPVFGQQAFILADGASLKTASGQITSH